MQSKTYEEMAKKESEAVQVKFTVISRLQKVEQELAQLRAEVKKRDEEIEVKNKVIFELKHDLNTRVPQLFKLSIDESFKHFTAAPGISKIQWEKSRQFNQLQKSGKNLIEEFVRRQRRNKPQIQHLLRARERLEQGGLGVKSLLGHSAEEILFRWGFLMVE